MFHSSVVPIALPVSLILGMMFFTMFNRMDLDPASSLAAAKIATGLVNVAIGIPKNLVAFDILSLLLVRPVSLVAAVGLVGWLAG